MDTGTVTWVVQVECHGIPVGPPVRCTLWNVWEIVAAYRLELPYPWTVEAYPEVKTS